MTQEPDYMVRAIRAGCERVNLGSGCKYPGCPCKLIPTAIRAAAPILMDEVRKETSHD